MIEKLIKYFEDSLAKEKQLLLSCTADELPNIQARAKYCQGALDMIGRAVKTPESEIVF